MTNDVALQNLCIVASRAQKAGLLDLKEAVGIVEAIETLAKSLNVKLQSVNESSSSIPSQ